MPGTGWALGTIHEPGCQQNEDNQPTTMLDDETRDRLGLPHEEP